MQLYLDTSAMVKLVVLEAESAALRDYLRAFPGDTKFTSALARAELVRAVARQGSPDSIAHTRRVLARIDLIPLTNRLLDSAASLTPPELRTLDAIHLSSALTAPELRAMITYDSRLAQAATDSGIEVLAPTHSR
jgi:predicted nucleic acid-binding protein